MDKSVESRYMHVALYLCACPFAICEGRHASGCALKKWILYWLGFRTCWHLTACVTQFWFWEEDLDGDTSHRTALLVQGKGQCMHAALFVSVNWKQSYLWPLLASMWKKERKKKKKSLVQPCLPIIISQDGHSWSWVHSSTPYVQKYLSSKWIKGDVSTLDTSPFIHFDDKYFRTDFLHF